VMMRYERRPDGSLVPLAQPNIDTGMGLERLLTVLQGKRDVYETDLFEPWVRTVRDLWQLDGTRMRLVCDHLRSAVVVLGDGVRPSNTGRGYVLRRLIRRALTTLWSTGPGSTLEDLPTEPIDSTLTHFGQSGDVRPVLLTEERRFRDTVSRGGPIVDRQLRRGGGELTEEDYHYLHDTHGLPRDLIDHLIAARG